MSATAQMQTEVTPRERPAAAEHHRISSVSFHHPLVVWSETTCTVAKGYVIVAARLTASLDWRECAKDEQPTGVGVSRVSKTSDGSRVVERRFVPLSNVAEIAYGA